MRQKWKILGTCCLMLCLLLQCMVFQPILVHAAPSASIKFSSSTVKVGDTVTVTATFSDGNTSLGVVDAMLTYDSSVLEYRSGSIAAKDSDQDGNNNATGQINKDGDGKVQMIAYLNDADEPVTAFTFQLKFQAKSASDSTVLEVNTTEFSTVDNVVFAPLSARKSLTIRTVSTDANLKSLTVSAGTLSPKFAAGTTSYTVNVANSVSSVTVNATAADSNAKVSGTGKQNLTAGKSTTVNVKVTAEDGKTTKTYKITINRAAATPKPTKTATPTKAPTPTRTPTVAPTETTTATTIIDPSVTPDATTQMPTEVPTETPSQEPGGSETVIPATSENSATPQDTAPTKPATTVTPKQHNGGNGLFSVQGAFLFCAIGMFFVGGTIGFILCYVVKSKR